MTRFISYFTKRFTSHFRIHNSICENTQLINDLNSQKILNGQLKNRNKIITGVIILNVIVLLYKDIHIIYDEVNRQINLID